MPPKSGSPSPATRGEKAGRHAASEMIKTLSPETGSVQGVVRRLEKVGIIVAHEHLKAGMPTAEVGPEHGFLRVGYAGALMVTHSRVVGVEPDRTVFDRFSGYRATPGRTWGPPVWEIAARSRAA